MSFIAQYSDECADCFEDVQGTECTYRGEQLVHVECPNGTAPLFERPDAPLCARCFCYHRGECA